MRNVAVNALQADEERALAERILAIEAELREVLADEPACRTILRPARARVGRTRATAVDRIEQAVNALDGADTSPETAALARARWAEAQALRWRLALSGMHVAQREAHRLASNPALAYPDLVQEGVLGLLAAAKRFEPDHEIRFATYARWWVRAHMTRAIDLSRLVHLSAAACEQLRNLRKQIRFHDVSGSAWTASGIASELGMDAERVRTLLAMGGTHSLDESGEDEDDSATAMQVADESVPPPDETVARVEDVERVRVAVRSALPERLRYVVASRYGIGREPRPLSVIARDLKLSRERVRQLEHTSIELLREAYGRGSVPGLARPPSRGRRTRRA
jgi:RNA polymerase sigma factor (sigma-70 family)